MVKYAPCVSYGPYLRSAPLGFAPYLVFAGVSQRSFGGDTMGGTLPRRNARGVQQVPLHESQCTFPCWGLFILFIY